MFRLADADAAWDHPVPVEVPVGDGRTERRVYTAHFRLLGASRIEALAAEGDEALLREALVGWRDIEDADGAPLEYGEESLSQLLDILHWRRSTAAEYTRFAAGLASKNSAAPPVIS